MNKMEREAKEFDGFVNFETYLVATWVARNKKSREHWARIHEVERRRAELDQHDMDLSVEQLVQFHVERKIHDAITDEIRNDASNVVVTLMDASCRRVCFASLAQFIASGMDRYAVDM